LGESVVRAATSRVEGLGLELSERQQMVLRAVVAAFVADAQPVSSGMVCHLLPVALSSASVRNTMAELARLGLIEKPHASAGRVPTEPGMRVFLDRLLETPDLAEYERRSLASDFDELAPDSLMEAASQLLSDRTHQLGFAMLPRIERLRLRHVSLVRVASDRVLVVLVPQTGPVQQRVIHEEGRGDQIELDRMAGVLNQRVAGRTLPELRRQLELELRELQSQATRLLARSLSLGLRFLAEAGNRTGDLVISSRLGLLSQPEFNDPDRIRGLFAAVETNERLVDLLDLVMEGGGDVVSISLGEELAEPGLRQCALVAVPYGGGAGGRAGGRAAGAAVSESITDERLEGPRGVVVRHGGDVGSSPALGVLGVIGPSRMDYARIIPLVSYCSQLVTEKLSQ
jgi:heat-inducible transcriptional repressor